MKIRMETSDLWERITAHHALEAAFARVQINGGSSGGDGISLTDFNVDRFAHLTQLRADILSGSYKSGLFRKVSIPKKKPGYRILTIPTIRDRVLHTSIAMALTPILEPVFEDSSFAYRPNRGVVQAVERIERWRKKGFDVVIEADIVSYFDNINHEILLEKLQSIIAVLPGAAAVLNLIDKMLKEQSDVLGTPGKGVVQGSPLSPLLANLYLDVLDEEIAEQGVKIVRYADDFVILCKSERKAKKVLEYCVDILARHNLQLHDDGTRIVSFDKGFDFVGYLFLKTLALQQKSEKKANQKAKPIKSNVTNDGIIELDNSKSAYDPGKRVLYIVDPEHHLTVRNRSFSVTRSDGSELIALPHRRVGRIEIGPDIPFDRQILDLALENGIEISLTDRFGQTKGHVTRFDAKQAKRHFLQAQCVCDATFRLAIAKRLVEARIRNQRTQLMRLNRTRNHISVENCLKQMKYGLRKVQHQETVQSLRGVEGAATAAYWPTLGTLLDGKNNTEEFRRSRPATDPCNAAINYLTGILERDIRAAIQSVSLHTGFAFLHEARDRHHGLVYDLMEPFRAPLTEGIVVYLFNANRLREEMFQSAPTEEIKISKEGRSALISSYEAAVEKQVNRPDKKGKLSWRSMMRFQARSLANAIEKTDGTIFYPYLMEA